jgi:hypothetical protein
LLLDGNKYVVVLPWFPGATKVVPGDYEIDTNSDSVTVTGPIVISGVGVEYDFQLPSPDKQPLIDGTLHLVWGTSSPKRLVSPPVRAMRSLVMRTSARPVTHHLFTALPFGGTRDDLVPPMTESQRRVFLAHLPPPVRHPDKRKVKLSGARVFAAADWHMMRSRTARRTVPTIRSVFDVAKQKRDVARFNALLAAFGGHYPGMAAPPSAGIGGATLNPPPH